MGEPRVLVVDDENDIRKHLVRALQREGMTVDQAADGEEGWRMFETTLHPVVLLDLRMPKRDGMSLLELIHDLRPETQVIVLTGHGTKADAISSVNLRAAAFLEKPLDLAVIVERVRTGWQEYQDRVGVSMPPPDGAPPTWRRFGGHSARCRRVSCPFGGAPREGLSL